MYKLKNKGGKMNIFSKTQDILLTTVRTWWRPITCVGISASVIVHGMYLPIITKTPANMADLAVLITAAVAAFAVREYGKIKGTAE